MTRPYAEVIGDPIAHSKSPLIHNFWLAKLGIDAEYRACHIRSGELAHYLALRREDANWRGCNVTIPHKESVARLVAALDPRTAAVGAVNTVLRQSDGALLAANTDVDGIDEAIGALDPLGGVALVLGAGGAARAAFASLGRCEVRRVRVLAREPAKAARASAECGISPDIYPFAPATGAFASVTLLINATQLGMLGQAPQPTFVLEELARLAPGALVFDMVYVPPRTLLLAAAEAQGLRTADGLTMLIGQAASAFARFFGAPAPREHDAALRTLLTA